MARVDLTVCFSASGPICLKQIASFRQVARHAAQEIHTEDFPSQPCSLNEESVKKIASLFGIVESISETYWEPTRRTYQVLFQDQKDAENAVKAFHGISSDSKLYVYFKRFNGVPFHSFAAHSAAPAARGNWPGVWPKVRPFATPCPDHIAVRQPLRPKNGIPKAPNTFESQTASSPIQAEAEAPAMILEPKTITAAHPQLEDVKADLSDSNAVSHQIWSNEPVYPLHGQELLPNDAKAVAEADTASDQNVGLPSLNWEQDLLEAESQASTQMGRDKQNDSNVGKDPSPSSAFCSRGQQEIGNPSPVMEFPPNSGTFQSQERWSGNRGNAAFRGVYPTFGRDRGKKAFIRQGVRVMAPPAIQPLVTDRRTSATYPHQHRTFVEDMNVIWVGNLSPQLDDSALRLIFSKYGEIAEINCIKNFAFITFREATAARQAIATENNTLHSGQLIHVRLKERRTPLGQYGPPFTHRFPSSSFPKPKQHVRPVWLAQNKQEVTRASQPKVQADTLSTCTQLPGVSASSALHMQPWIPSAPPTSPQGPTSRKDLPTKVSPYGYDIGPSQQERPGTRQEMNDRREHRAAMLFEPSDPKSKQPPAEPLNLRPMTYVYGPGGQCLPCGPNSMATYPVFPSVWNGAHTDASASLWDHGAKATGQNDQENEMYRGGTGWEHTERTFAHTTSREERNRTKAGPNRFSPVPSTMAHPVGKNNLKGLQDDKNEMHDNQRSAGSLSANPPTTVPPQAESAEIHGKPETKPNLVAGRNMVGYEHARHGTPMLLPSGFHPLAMATQSGMMPAPFWNMNGVHHPPYAFYGMPTLPPPYPFIPAALAATAPNPVDPTSLDSAKTTSREDAVSGDSSPKKGETLNTEPMPLQHQYAYPALQPIFYAPYGGSSLPLVRGHLGNLERENVGSPSEPCTVTETRSRRSSSFEGVSSHETAQVGTHDEGATEEGAVAGTGQTPFSEYGNLLPENDDTIQLMEVPLYAADA